MATILVAYLVLFFFVAIVGRSYLVWRRTGLNPYSLGRSDSAHDFIGSAFRLSLGLVAVVVLSYAFLPPLYELFTPILWLEQPLIRAVGVVFLTLSLFWILIAQRQMGDAWRIGIDSNRHTELVRQGLFHWSRNPIFLGMRLSLFGLFLSLPTALTLALWLLGDVLLQLQVRLEEEHLSRLHGDTYQAYRQQTRRWL